MPETVTDKLLPLGRAISENLGHGDAVVLGACLEPDIPFAATYEIIRQGIGGLNVIAPISDASTDMLIGAGCVAEVTGAWVGNVSGGLGHNYRRALEDGEPGPVIVHDHSNFSLAMALLAGAHGMPYVPLRSILGSDIARSNPRSGAPRTRFPRPASRWSWCRRYSPTWRSCRSSAPTATATPHWGVRPLCFQCLTGWGHVRGRVKWRE